MNVKSINILPLGQLPVRTKSSKSDDELKDIIKQAKALKEGSGVVVTLEGKSFQPFMAKLRKMLDPEKYEVYRCKSEVAIAKLPAKG